MGDAQNNRFMGQVEECRASRRTFTLFPSLAFVAEGRTIKITKRGANYFLENMSKTWRPTNINRGRKQMDDIDLTVKLKR